MSKPSPGAPKPSASKITPGNVDCNIEIKDIAVRRVVSGYRKPSKVNEVAFEQAVEDVAEATRRMLSNILAKAT